MRELGYVPTDGDARVTSNRLRPDQDQVTLRVPALRRYVAALRSLTTALAAQCNLTVDEIEDVQMSIDEACALLLPHVERSRPWLDVTFHLVESRFAAQVEVATSEAVYLDRQNLSWTVLTALVDEAEIVMDGRSLGITFAKVRGAIGSIAAPGTPGAPGALDS
jgi:serine/threonine-protein kinase RsbW